MRTARTAVGRDASRSLLSDFSTDAAHVTEVRRVLQTLIRRSRSDECQIYMVTSAARSEGKTTICALLAIVAARILNRRTLILDGDMRRPMMHTLIDVPLRPGLYDYLSRGAALDAVRRPTSLPTLHAIAGGRAGAAASEAYDDKRFAALLASVRPSYDLVFVDAAPVVPVVEPIIMAEHVDGILLVAMAGSTPVTMIRRMKGILAPVESKIVGAIVNNASEGLPYYYDYRYYGYRPGDVRRLRDASRESEGGGVAIERTEGAAQETKP